MDPYVENPDWFANLHHDLITFIKQTLQSRLPESYYAQSDLRVWLVETIEHGPFKESYIEIRRRQGKSVRLVTSLEVLSPSNKTVGNPGREQYVKKQREVLGGEVNLVEIDLLRKISEPPTGLVPLLIASHLQAGEVPEPWRSGRMGLSSGSFGRYSNWAPFEI